MSGIHEVSFDLEGLTLLKDEAHVREWVNPMGAYVMARLSSGTPGLPTSAEQLRDQLSTVQHHGRLVSFETLRVARVLGVLFVVEMSFHPNELEGVGQTPSYSATMTVPLASCSIDFNAAYNTRLAELAPTGIEAASLDDPPVHLAELLRRIAMTLRLEGRLKDLPPFWADG